MVLVGTSGSGKTSYRRRLVRLGLPEDHVVSLDDLRRQARAEDRAYGRPLRRLQGYSVTAVRRAARRADALAALGVGYVADATHLTRRERRVHLRTAAETRLEAVAVLTPALGWEVLLARDAARPLDEQVPVEALARQAARRSMLSAAGLLEEGFALVVEL